MLCYVVLCYVMLCYVMLCYVVESKATSTLVSWRSHSCGHSFIHSFIHLKRIYRVSTEGCRCDNPVCLTEENRLVPLLPPEASVATTDHLSEVVFTECCFVYCRSCHPMLLKTNRTDCSSFYCIV